MSADPLTCPICNARVALPVGAAGGQRVTCDRCGEDFTLPSTAVSTAPLRPATPPVAPTPYRKPVAANWQVGAVVLGMMVLMAGVGLTYALLTVGNRRGHDRNLPRASRRPALPPLVVKPPSAPATPAQLTGLGYLLPGTTAAAGVHVNDLLGSPVGERLKAAPIKVGPLELSLDSVEPLIGVPAGNIDHLVVGSVLEVDGEASLTPPTILVIRTREPVGVNRLREVLRAESPRTQPAPDGGTRPVSKARLRDVPLTLWLPNSTTIVLGLFTGLEKLPGERAEDASRLTAETRAALEGRLAVGTVAWAVAHSADWAKSPLLSALPVVKALPIGEKLDGVRTLAVGLPRERPLRVQAAIRAADEAAAGRLEQEAARRSKDGKVKLGREEEWLSVQVQFGE